jgi:hypothetical protein
MPTVGCLFVLLFGEFRALGGYPRTRACLLAQVLGLGVLQHPPVSEGRGHSGAKNASSKSSPSATCVVPRMASHANRNGHNQTTSE